MESTWEDVVFYFLNMLHDLGHDYFNDSNRTASFNEVANLFVDQNGGGVAVINNYEIPQVPHKKNIKIQRNTSPIAFNIANKYTTEARARDHVDDVFYELMFYYIGFTFENGKLLQKDVKRNVWMSLKKDKPNTMGDFMYNAFVTRCYGVFSKEYDRRTLDSIRKVKSTDIVSDIRKFYNAVKRNCRNSQNGGGAQRKKNNRGKGRYNPIKKTDEEQSEKKTGQINKKHIKMTSNEFIENIILHHTYRFIGYNLQVIKEIETKNHFYKLQYDALSNLLNPSAWSRDTDESIIQAAQNVVSSHAGNINLQNDIDESEIMLELQQQPNRFVIDNAGLQYHMLHNKVFCPVSTMMDGISNMDISKCHDINNGYRGEDGDMHVEMNANGVNNDKYSIIIDRTNGIIGININFSWGGGRELVTTLDTTYEPYALVAKNVYKRAIKSLNADLKDDKLYETAYSHLIFKSMGDILQEWNGLLKNGGYTATPTYTPGTNARRYDTNGDALRVVFSNDRPSATRIIWAIYNGLEKGASNARGSEWSEHINTQCVGGFTGASHKKNSTEVRSVSRYFLYSYSHDTVYTYEHDNFILGNAFAKGGNIRLKVVEGRLNNNVKRVPSYSYEFIGPSPYPHGTLYPFKSTVSTHSGLYSPDKFMYYDETNVQVPVLQALGFKHILQDMPRYYAPNIIVLNLLNEWLITREIEVIYPNIPHVNPRYTVFKTIPIGAKFYRNITIRNNQTLINTDDNMRLLWNGRGFVKVSPTSPDPIANVVNENMIISMLNPQSYLQQVPHVGKNNNNQIMITIDFPRRTNFQQIIQNAGGNTEENGIDPLTCAIIAIGTLMLGLVGLQR